MAVHQEIVRDIRFAVITLQPAKLRAIYDSVVIAEVIIKPDSLRLDESEAHIFECVVNFHERICRRHENVFRRNLKNLRHKTRVIALLPGSVFGYTEKDGCCAVVSKLDIGFCRIFTNVGIAMNASVIEPESAVSPVERLNSSLMNGPSVTMPMKPITTDGMAARSSIPAFSTSFVLRGAISAIKSALAIPIGIEIIPAPAVTKIEPMISG